MRSSNPHPHIIWAAIITHYIWAIAYFWPTETEVTALADSRLMLTFFGFGHAYLGMFLVATGALVALMIFDRHRKLSLALIIPQQAVLMAGFWGAFFAIRKGVFPDGYVPKADAHCFILKDQAFAMTVAVFHSIAIIEMYAGTLIANCSCSLKQSLRSLLPPWGRS